MYIYVGVYMYIYTDLDGGADVHFLRLRKTLVHDVPHNVF